MSDAGKTSTHMGGGTASPKDDLKRTGEELRTGAKDAAAQAKGVGASVKNEVTRAASELKNEGAEIADAAKSRALGFAEEQKRLGADQAQGMATAVRRAADELEQASPQMAHYVREAASSVDGMARALRDQSPTELMGTVQDFARRQPVAFFGAAVLAGFAFARFAKSSAQPEGLYAGNGSADYGSSTAYGDGMGATGMGSAGVGGASMGSGVGAGMGAGTGGMSHTGSGASMGAGASMGTGTGMGSTAGMGSSSSGSGLGGSGLPSGGVSGASPANPSVGGMPDMSGTKTGTGLGAAAPLGGGTGTTGAGTTGTGTGGSVKTNDMGGPRQPGSGPLAGL